MAYAGRLGNRRWNELVKRKFCLAQVKTTGLIYDWLSRLQEQWANQDKRRDSEDKSGDPSATSAAKQDARNLIDDIGALADRLRNLPTWPSPYLILGRRSTSYKLLA